ncbi:MAG TPA: glycosyltransferase [Bacteroidales bacterium]|nr:glycosyltransferase [Bacteroidales bacterium]
MDNIITVMTILILADTEFTNDPRIIRQAASLQNNSFSVVVLCLKMNGENDVGEIQGITYQRFYDSKIHDIKAVSYHQHICDSILEQFEFDCVHCHNESMLNIAVMMKKRKPVPIIYDSHELFHAWPLNVSSKCFSIRIKSIVIRHWAIRREKHNSRYIDYCITVCDSLADNLWKYFKLRERPLVVRNIPQFTEIKSKSNILREYFNIPKQTKILVFIGIHIYPKTLNLEQVIDEVKNKENLALLFITTFNEGKRAIENYADSVGAQNVFFHEAIHPDEIPNYLSSADVGLVPTWNKKDLSYWYALDNKLFEYILAGIPVLATRQPEYVKIVEQYSVGICVNPDLNGDYRRGLIDILNNYQYYIEKNEHIRKILNWENEVETFIDFYKQIRPDVEKCS